MRSRSILNFMRQQGFPQEPAAVCDMHFEGLLFQPWIVFPLVLVAGFLASAPLFLALALVLAWNVTLPRLNPFELFYNRLVARPRGRPPLAPAPPPRRFAQGMAAAFNLGAGVSLLAGWSGALLAFEIALVLAFSLLLFGRFCLGAYLFHLLRGELAFANATLPWGRGSEPSAGA